MTRIEKTLASIEDIIRLRRAQLDNPGNRNLAVVRARLEDEIGATVSQRLAARVLGLSHTALQRWISRGDIPTVFTTSGRKEVPVSTIVDLADSLAEQKAAGTRKQHFIEAVVMRDRARAEQLRTTIPPSERSIGEDPHDRALGRALRYHAAVARRLDRQMVEEARHNISKWRNAGKLHERYAEQWEEILSRPIEDIRRQIVSDDQIGRDLRQNSPFAGALSEAERREIFRSAA